MIKVIEIWSKERFDDELKRSAIDIDSFSKYMADLGI
jgi:spore coat protein CotH